VETPLDVSLESENMSTKKCPFCAEEIQLEAVKCKHCGSWLTQPGTPPPPPGADVPLGTEAHLGSKRLTRSTTDRMLAGVCGGIARNIGVDPTIIRIAYAVLTFFTAIFPGIILYILLAIIIPAESDV
jgi:phage shock protein C